MNAPPTGAEDLQRPPGRHARGLRSSLSTASPALTSPRAAPPPRSPRKGHDADTLAAVAAPAAKEKLMRGRAGEGRANFFLTVLGRTLTQEEKHKTEQAKQRNLCVCVCVCLCGESNSNPSAHVNTLTQVKFFSSLSQFFFSTLVISVFSFVRSVLQC